jgi:hypothetical protein
MKRHLILFTFILVALSACGSTSVPEPVGIGSGVDELKRSPCACMEVPQDYSGWRIKG